MRRYCPNCKQVIDGGTAVCPHCSANLPRLMPTTIKRSNTTIPQYSAWDKFRYRQRHQHNFRDLQVLYIIGLLVIGWALVSGNWQFVIVGFVLGLLAVILMALSMAFIKWRAKRPAKLLYGRKEDQVSDWLEALAKKDRKE